MCVVLVRRNVLLYFCDNFAGSMISSHVKQHSFRGPKPEAASGLADKRYASLGNLFKSDSSTSLHDIVITSTRTSQKADERRRSRRESRTVVPLLGRDGSTAALVPERSHSLSERDVSRSSPGKKKAVVQALRFPLLSPTRQETMLFFRMKALKK